MRRVRRRVTTITTRRSSRSWIPPGEFSLEKTLRDDGKELKHCVKAPRTHVVPSLCVSVPVWNDDKRG